MNEEKESVFYVAFNKETAIAEEENESGLSYILINISWIGILMFHWVF